MKPVLRFAGAAVLALLLTASASAQTGKIAGTVTDAATGNPLPGVNVVIVGTQQGATTNADGDYTIINVQPGNYDVRASFIGYAPVTQQGVNVNIDLTTDLDFEMQEQTEQLEEVTVQATEPVVKRDISANVANMSSDEIENLPVTSVEEVVGLQAGVRGLSVRGSGADQISMTVDGMTMRQGRTNRPFTSISYTSVKEVQVQTGGFNAEYGNVRSGLINVVTKEGPRDHYTADALVRYSGPQKRYFGSYPNDPNAYWMRPFLPNPDIPDDRDPAYVGTRNSVWDQYTQNQYPTFDGWNAISEGLMSDDDPNNDLTPDQLIEVFNFRHRKDLRVDDPDYTVDATIGGPVPGISTYLGDLRFLTSLRTTQSAYMIPQSRDFYRDWTGRVKLTSDVASRMKLTLQSMYGKESGLHAGNYEGDAGMWRGGTSTIGGYGGDQRDRLFGKGFWNPMDVTRFMVGGELTHTLSSKTFYELRLQRSSTDYLTRPWRERSDEVVRTIGAMDLNEAPFGYETQPANSFSGLRLAGHWGKPRDSSEVAVWDAKFDLTSQLNQFLQLKTGMEYILNRYDMNYGRLDPAHVTQNHWYTWSRQPRQGAAYAQSKLEFEGIVANAGLRLDYFYPYGTWYVYSPYDRAFSGQVGIDQVNEALEQEPVDRQFYLSPRLGVSFPITENSKFFFNYGHFRQMLDPVRLFTLRAIFAGKIDEVGNPDHPMPRTIAYELGYEQNVLDQFLIRMTGYYKDETEQPRSVSFHDITGTVDYHTFFPYNYGDTRGFEISLRKNRGRWIRGFVNYTFMVNSGGNFGVGQHNENMADQREFLRTMGASQWISDPRPYARINLELLTPVDFGPETIGLHPVGDWRLSLLGNWRTGNSFLYTGQISVPNMDDNVQWSDYYNLDMRLAKNINVGLGDLQVFADISNVLNIRHFHQAGFEGDFDRQAYMQSLHYPEGTFEQMDNPPHPFIPGDDQPGDIRAAGAPFVPIEIVGDISKVTNPKSRPLYYEQVEDGQGRYMWYRDGAFSEADKEYVDAVLENKQYIDMPNESYFRYLNPRRVEFGLRVSF